MRDADIRAALHRTELARFAGQPDTLVLDELGICQGDYRIDVAVVNGALHGWEIKSERDTLSRLPAQAAAYSRVFDRVTVVCGPSHLEGVSAIVPDWWGVTVARAGRRDALKLERVRRARDNPAPDAYAVAQLLWRDEAIELLRQAGLRGKALRGMRRHLWAQLTELYPFPELAAHVRATVKRRGNWRHRSAERPELPQDEQHVV